MPPPDTNTDGTPDWQDDDSDGDGVLDRDEWPAAGCLTMGNDADGDGIPNFRDLDSDNNGRTDALERCPPPNVLTMLGRPACGTGPYDFDGDGTPDFLDFDNDHDTRQTGVTSGLTDIFELGMSAALTDTDNDAIPDLYDRDSDNDGLYDFDEGAADRDLDGIPNFRDLDSDGDGVPDACEHGGDLTPPLLDTDGDGQPNFLDRDTDGDLLADNLEDRDGSCTINPNESDRLRADTDGDGVNDLIETVLYPGTGPSWASTVSLSPENQGVRYFVMPYQGTPTPASRPVPLSTQLRNADIAMIVDTSGSMAAAVAALRAEFATVVAPLATRIVSPAFGVANQEDFPLVPFGSATQSPARVPSTGALSTTSSNAQTALNSLAVQTGGDAPGSQLSSAWRAITGSGLSWMGGSLAAVAPAAGLEGSLRFRTDAVPFVALLTNATMHEGRRALTLAPPVGSMSPTDYGGIVDSYGPTVTAAANADVLVTTLNSRGGTLIGLAVSGNVQSLTAVDPYGPLAYLADKTGSFAPPSAFGGTACLTGIGGAAATADGPGGSCRLVFAIPAGSPSGIGAAITSGVGAAISRARTDVWARGANVGVGPDALAAFVERVVPLVAGGTDFVAPMTTCAPIAEPLVDRFTGPGATAGADGIAETITLTGWERTTCFALTPKPNTTITPTTVPQLFRVRLTPTTWLGALRAAVPLGVDREIVFIVPPNAP